MRGIVLAGSVQFDEYNKKQFSMKKKMFLKKIGVCFSHPVRFIYL